MVALDCRWVELELRGFACLRVWMVVWRGVLEWELRSWVVLGRLMLVEPGLVGALQPSCWVQLEWSRRGFGRAVVDADLVGSVEDG